jgi:YbbR domain-containing protein
VADVEVKFDGKLPEGYEIGNVTTSPNKVKLRGPSDRVSALRKIVTESVSLDDRKESFDLPDVAVIVGDSKVEAVEPTVNVHVEVVEKKKQDGPVSQQAMPSLIANIIPSWRVIRTPKL